jgi:DNA-3-methyladenine glycosylase I
MAIFINLVAKLSKTLYKGNFMPEGEEKKNQSRCSWALGSQLYLEYHDHEWGVPVHDDRKLFEMLVLEGAQAGLSWSTILNKRQGYRQAFDNFEPELVARYDERKFAELMANPAIVRNRLKIAAAIQNARTFLEIQQQHGSFDEFIWQFVHGQQIQNSWPAMGDVPATTSLSDALSKTLSKAGFRFVGSTICYSFMQAVGLVNDHIIPCFRWTEICSIS